MGLFSSVKYKPICNVQYYLTSAFIAPCVFAIGSTKQ